jgi:hypothetical protein
MLRDVSPWLLVLIGVSLAAVFAACGVVGGLLVRLLAGP